MKRTFLTLAALAAGTAVMAEPALAAPAAEAVEAAAEALQSGNVALHLCGRSLLEEGLRLAGKIAGATGAALICDTFFTRMERGGDLPKPVKLPYFPDQAVALLEGFDKVITIGAEPPVAFFGYPDGTSHLTRPEQDVVLALHSDDVLNTNC